MLSQHLLTAPVFNALFKDYEFAEHNPVAQAMNAVLDILDRHRAGLAAVVGQDEPGGAVQPGELVPGGSRRTGLLLTALFAATPMSVVLSMAYTEALFCALVAWALVDHQLSHVFVKNADAATIDQVVKLRGDTRRIGKVRTNPLDRDTSTRPPDGTRPTVR